MTTRYQTRSTVIAAVEETTEGVLEPVTAGTQFTAVRQGFNVTSAVQTVQSDELVNDIGASEGFVTKETPSASIPKYFKHSSVEGQEPDYAVYLKSAFGSMSKITTERSTTTGSTAGTAAARAQLELAAGGDDYPLGVAVLIKDGANGYAIRNSMGNSTNSVPLNFNLSAAPASGVSLGKAVTFKPVATGHPTFTLHQYQASDSSSGYHQAIAGCRTTSITSEFTANSLGSISFDVEGVRAYRNPIQITADNCKIDFDIGASALVATLSQDTYQSPMELAREVATKMTAAAGETVSCSFDSTTGKFTISVASGSLTLLWNTGTNTADGAHTTLGFSSAADDSGATSYTSDNELTYGPPVDPSFDDSKPNVVKDNELFIGNYARNQVRSFRTVGWTMSTPKTDDDDGSSPSGVSGSVVLERTVGFTATIAFRKHEVDDFDALINNTTTQFMYNSGQKLGGNWVPGTCENLFSPNAKITGTTISDSDGIVVKQLTITCFVSPTAKDVYHNLL